MSELQRYADPAFSLMLSRPGTRLGASGGNYFGAEFNSRPPSGMGGAATNRHAERAAATKSASGIPRLPPLDRTMSLSTGALRQVID